MPPSPEEAAGRVQHPQPGPGATPLDRAHVGDQVGPTSEIPGASSPSGATAPSPGWGPGGLVARPATRHDYHGAMPGLSIRLRSASRELLGLPWNEPLAAWSPDEVAFRALPVGPSRHLVRFVEADGVLYALKELPERVAAKEYRVLRALDAAELPAVRPLGLVEQHDSGDAILVTRYLEHSWQYRRLFQRLGTGPSKHRDRLLDAMAMLVVDLHRSGVFWGDCSLANTLLARDGQLLQAFLVDAETSETHPALSDGQRALDVGILVENVAGDLADLSLRLGGGPDGLDDDVAAAESVAARYEQLWDELSREETFGVDERYRVEKRVRRLNDLGFAVDELAFEPAT